MAKASGMGAVPPKKGFPVPDVKRGRDTDKPIAGVGVGKVPMKKMGK